MKLLLFIPCYNCEPQIARTIEQLEPLLIKHFACVLFVDNISSDNTLERAISASKKLVRPCEFVFMRNEKNHGLGGSHKVAFDYAVDKNFDFICVLHGDDQANLRDFASVISVLATENTDAVLGSRFMKNSELSGYSTIRTIGNLVFNFLFGVVLRTRIYDLGSGLNIFSVPKLSQIRVHNLPDDLTFNYGLLSTMVLADFKIRFVPISWREKDQISNLRAVTQVFLMLAMMKRILINGRQFVELDHRRVVQDDYRTSVYKVLKAKSI